VKRRPGGCRAIAWRKPHCEPDDRRDDGRDGSYLQAISDMMKVDCGGAIASDAVAEHQCNGSVLEMVGPGL